MLFRSFWWDGAATSSSSSGGLPSGNISYPSDGTSVAGQVSVIVSSFDTEGIQLIRLHIDGSFFQGGYTGTSTVFLLSTQDLSNGAHTLYAEVRDISVNSTYTTTITINVSNTFTSAFNGSFIGSPLTGVVPVTVSFAASISGNIAYILWDPAGDGTYETSTSSYLYVSAGTYSPAMRLVASTGSTVDIINTNYLTFTALTTTSGDVNWRSWRTRL